MDAVQKPGSRIKALRKKTPGLTVQAVAAAVGISRSHLNMIETGGDLPGRETLVAIADYYGVSFDYILHGRDTPPEPPQTSEVVDDPNELALLAFWRSLSFAERKLMLKMLGVPPPP